MRIPFLLKVALCLCVLSVLVGGVFLFRYETTAGQAGNTPQRWPANIGIAPAPNGYTLLLFAHPHCPCTRASLEELNRLLAKSPGNVMTHVLFLQPEGTTEDWMKTDLRQKASAIPGVIVHDDAGGRMAREFGADTSGYVVLYDSRGQLLFKGGITSARGHAGDNIGESAIVLLLSGKIPQRNQTPVFGCSIETTAASMAGIVP